MIFFNDKEYDISPGESVLQALLRQGVNLAHSCQSGVCQSCTLKMTAKPKQEWQSNMPFPLRQQNCFLPCVCYPQEDITIVDDPLNTTAAKILAKDLLSPSVLRVRLKTQEGFEALPGQFISVCKDDLIRSYSISNRIHYDGYLELHIRYRNTRLGGLSHWFFAKAKVGDWLDIRGPYGECCYTYQGDKNLLLIAHGTGLSPIYGVLQEAISNNHEGQIKLYHICDKLSDLYYVSQLQKISKIAYKPYILVDFEALENEILHALQPNQLVYLAGGQRVVAPIRQTIFLQGVSSKNIFADEFVSAKAA